MKAYKLIIITLLMLAITLGTVHATEEANTTSILDQQQDDALITENEKTFNDIQTEIDNTEDSATINLEGTYESTGKEITINKTITIDGHKKTTLDAKKSSTFIYLDHIPKLTVKGVKFTNADFLGYDATTRWNNGYADEIAFTDCEFHNNYGYFLDISSKKATFTNCNFISNHASLFMLDSDDLTVRNCNFIKNHDQIIARAKIIDHCSFQENTMMHFDTIENAKSITNTVFTKNTLVITNVDSMQNNRFESNTGRYHMIEKAGTVEGCVFTKNDDAMLVNCNTIKNSRFDYNKCDLVNNGNTITNCRFTGNTGWNKFLNVQSITGSIFKNNKGCFIQNKKLTVKNTQFINNKGYLVGKTFYKCTFSKNDMDIDAGTISNSKFTKNIFKVYKVTGKTVKKCTFTQNKCYNLMVYANTVTSSKFIKNTCHYGLVGADKVYKCRFEKNTVAKKGAGSVVEGAKLIKKSVFKYNIGKKGSIVSDSNTVDGCTFKSNKVTDFGFGTVYFVKKVLNTKFTNNKALHGTGGAIEEVNVVKKCTFTNNYALMGGAVSTLGKFTIEKCTFTKNKSKYSGSAIYLTSLSGKLKGAIKNCKFSKNKAKGTVKTFDYPFKNYKRGTVFAFGDYKMSLKVKKCKGL